MKFKRLLVLFLLINTISCNNPASVQKKDSTTKKVLVKSKIAKTITQPLNAIKAINTVFVIDTNGIEAKEKPDSTSATLQPFEFGQALEIVNTKGDWLGVRPIFSAGEASAYIKKAGVGDETDIPLSNQNLAEVFYEGDQEPAPYPNIELNLITKAQFYAMKKTSVDYFTADTAAVKKRNGTFKLPLKKGTITYTDKAHQYEYDYAGQLKAINKYVVMGVYYEAEDENYELVDKTTSKTYFETFSEIPVLSADKTRIMCIHADDYHGSHAQLFMYTLHKDSVQQYAMGEFKKWAPAQTREQFWGSDNCYYVPVIPAVVYNIHYTTGYDKGLIPGYNYRYIKIKINGPNNINNQQ